MAEDPFKAWSAIGNPPLAAPVTPERASSQTPQPQQAASRGSNSVAPMRGSLSQQQQMQRQIQELEQQMQRQIQELEQQMQRQIQELKQQMQRQIQELKQQMQTQQQEQLSPSPSPPPPARATSTPSLEWPAWPSDESTNEELPATASSEAGLWVTETFKRVTLGPDFQRIPAGRQQTVHTSQPMAPVPPTLEQQLPLKNANTSLQAEEWKLPPHLKQSNPPLASGQGIFDSTWAKLDRSNPGPKAPAKPMAPVAIPDGGRIKKPHPSANLSTLVDTSKADELKARWTGEREAAVANNFSIICVRCWALKLPCSYDWPCIDCRQAGEFCQMVSCTDERLHQVCERGTCFRLHDQQYQRMEQHYDRGMLESALYHHPVKVGGHQHSAGRYMPLPGSARKRSPQNEHGWDGPHVPDWVLQAFYRNTMEDHGRGAAVKAYWEECNRGGLAKHRPYHKSTPLRANTPLSQTATRKSQHPATKKSEQPATKKPEQTTAKASVQVATKPPVQMASPPANRFESLAKLEPGMQQLDPKSWRDDSYLFKLYQSLKDDLFPDPAISHLDLDGFIYKDGKYMSEGHMLIAAHEWARSNGESQA